MDSPNKQCGVEPFEAEHGILQREADETWFFIGCRTTATSTHYSERNIFAIAV